MHRQLGSLAEWSTPEAGMFFWFKLLLRDPSSISAVNNADGLEAVEDDSEALVLERAIKHGVIALPGATFLPTGGRSAYVRASFSLQSPENVEEALHRLRLVVLEVRREKALDGTA